jgi:hypothetical protein
MKRKLLIVFVFTLLTSMLHAITTFATGMVLPESITQTASGFIVTDVTGAIWMVPAGGGAASLLTTVPFGVRGGMIMPATFGSLGGRFLAVGVNGKGMGEARGAASTIDLSVSPPTITPFATEPRTIWFQPLLATDFGSFTGDILVTNGFFEVDFFSPTGGIGTVATFLPKAFMKGVLPFGAAFAPSGFGSVGGTLLVSDTQPGSGAIYSVDSTGNTSLFTTIPLSGDQTGLRQIAFAPQGFGSFGGDLFVSVETGIIYVVNGQGTIVGHISGDFDPRGLFFLGDTTLLFSDQSLGQILSATPGDVTP